MTYSGFSLAILLVRVYAMFDGNKGLVKILVFLYDLIPSVFFFPRRLMMRLSKLRLVYDSRDDHNRTDNPSLPRSVYYIVNYKVLTWS